MTRAFADTNILVYAFGEEPKTEPARRIIEAGGVLSVQSLNEFANVARRKLKYSWIEIETALAALKISFSEIVMLDMDVHQQGLQIAQRYNLSIYDSMIIAAALGADCDTLYSEDMQDGLVVDGRLRIVNPFAVK